MRLKIRTACVAALALAMAGCGGPGEPAGASDSGSGAPSAPAATSAPAAAPAAAAATASAPADFAVCTACHSPVKGTNGVGPSLFGVVGRKAGSLAGFNYSPALKASGITWDEASLDKWLTNPQAMVPGTMMGFPGYADPAKRQAVIAYLKTLQ